MTAKPQSGPSTPLGTSVKKLGEQAQGILHRLLDQQVPPESIAHVLWLQTRESISPEAITRYASRYQKRKQEQQQLRETVDGQIARASQQGLTTSDMPRAVLMENVSRAQRNGTLKKMDLVLLEGLQRKQGELELKQQQARLSSAFRERELDLKERQTRIAEERFQLDRAKAQAVLDRLTRKAQTGQRLTTDDVRRVQEVYGLYQDNPAPEDKGSSEEKYVSR